MTDPSYYSIHPKFHVAVDCIIFGFEGGELSLLLLKRNFQPALGEWSLMGGFVEEGESMDDAARRIAASLTGLTDLYMRQVKTYGEVGRDPGERVLSTAYYALVDINRYNRDLVREHNAFWVRLPEVPHLIFDHDSMVADALRFMRYQASVKPVGLNLLPEEFTLPQLQALYEAIFGEPLDKRNFRKRIASMPYIEKTGGVDKSLSRKGAALYRFDPERYDENPKFKI
ncbi:MAG: NUDIX domain-containing protein [Bacteroidales bacterium]|nr:NUDIX domain-containing protein [Bacteroidales bacterium]MBR1571081.1 NUDIX domain-containing protein [Bacteroidales bacterium]